MEMIAMALGFAIAVAGGKVIIWAAEKLEGPKIPMSVHQQW